MNKPNTTVNNIISSVFDSLESNNFQVLGNPDEPMFEKPLIGVAAGDDQYFEFLKDHIGAFHLSPLELFAKKYVDTPDPSALRVISLVFPQTEKTKELQNKQLKYPCKNWYLSRGEWEKMMKEFSIKIEESLESEGIKAVCVDLIDDIKEMQSQSLGAASNWSHRHAAFAAGMGTFGLSDGFISERGMAVRLATIIVEADLEVTDRGNRGHYDWCLYFKSGICGSCIRRCPVRAITEKGHDKVACGNYKDTVCADNWPEEIDRNGYKIGCGLCQTKIPCMDKRP